MHHAGYKLVHYNYAITEYYLTTCLRKKTKENRETEDRKPSRKENDCIKHPKNESIT